MQIIWKGLKWRWSTKRPELASGHLLDQYRNAELLAEVLQRTKDDLEFLVSTEHYGNVWSRMGYFLGKAMVDWRCWLDSTVNSLPSCFRIIVTCICRDLLNNTIQQNQYTAQYYSKICIVLCIVFLFFSSFFHIFLNIIQYNTIKYMYF